MAVFVVAVLVIEQTHFDLRFADWLYRLEGGQWALKHNFITSVVLHDAAQNLSRSIALVLLLLAVSSHFHQRLAPYTKGFWLLFAVLATAASIVGIAKALTHVDCPWGLQRYGGQYPYLSIYASLPDTVVHGNCFPAGHASGGYGLVALYFFFLYYNPQWKWYGLAIGLGMGMVYGFVQQLRGAHFISHDLWTLAICWLVALFWYRLLFRCNSESAYHRSLN
jgi:membrane-associated PAP2 superfamily phosphatase